MPRPSSEDIEHLAALFEQSEWTEMRLKMDGLEIFWSNEPTVQISNETTAPVAIPDGMAAVRAPHLGTFHRAAASSAPPKVEVGQTIDAETEVCCIEVLDTVTPIKAGMKGIVREICAADAELVEFDDPLVIIEPVD